MVVIREDRLRRDDADAFCRHGLLIALARRLEEDFITRIIRVRAVLAAVERPELVDVEFAARELGLEVGEKVPARGLVRLDQLEVPGIAGLAFKIVLFAKVVFEAEKNLLDRHARADHVAQESFVARNRFGILSLEPVVGRKVEENQIGMAGHDVPLQPENPQLRTRSTDGGVDEIERTLRIFRAKILSHQRAIARQLRVGGIRAPGQ